MAKKNQRLVSKKTKKKMKRAAPWAIAAATTLGMIASIADRTVRSRVKTIAADAVDKVRTHGKSRLADGAMANGILPQEHGASGAV